jgi:hypothetical protein
MKRFVLSVVAAALASASLLLAAPDFSGDWKLNPAKSEYGSFPAPTDVTRTVRQDRRSISMSTRQSGPQGQVTTELSYTTDGKPAVNKNTSGESTGSARWEGEQLVIESAREIQGTQLKSREVWTLSAGGATLTITTHLTLPQGEFDVKQVFERQ